MKPLKEQYEVFNTELTEEEVKEIYKFVDEVLTEN